LELPVVVENVSVALVVVPEGRLSPATVFLLATGLQGIAISADVLAALGIRTIRPAVVSILAAISILTTICILVTIAILATIAITSLVGSIVSIALVGSTVSSALKVSVDVLDLSTAILEISKLGRLPSTTAVVAGGI
jgi:hypothetical protein